MEPELCECCNAAVATHLMEWDEWLCDECMESALAEDDEALT